MTPPSSLFPAEPMTDQAWSGNSSTALISGIVVAAQANYYWVALTPPAASPDAINPPTAAPERDASAPGAYPCDRLLCTRRTRLKKIGQQVMVGDLVQVEEPDWEGQRGAIAAVQPRHSELDRPPIANADQVLLVFALADPPIDPVQLSRFLVKAETTGLQVQVCLNKADLVDAATQAAWRDRLQSWGYDPVLISTRQPLGLSAILARLRQRLTVIAGPSGVGKSSLINTLIPDAALRVAAVSGKLRRGRHTTRHVELFDLPEGGLLADTPGFNQPDITVAPRDLGTYFPEIRDRDSAASCQFSDCLHQHEPNCAIRGTWERYDHYLTFLADAIAYQQDIEQRTDEESAVKLKTQSGGETQAEPKLSPKKYRRPSRRSQKQALADLRYDQEFLDQLDDPDGDA